MNTNRPSSTRPSVDTGAQPTTDGATTQVRNPPPRPTGRDTMIGWYFDPSTL
ncbi:MAG: hypothetical protein H6700_05555 [Myxococcales bacterium]|nr:hypothetical protein [Myxococcales bacterium]MCB9520167.1 hypothetical protein [Myxococcales bacterium]MCB9531211.1 hypothetical protein [Myxococcales bacterium]